MAYPYWKNKQKSYYGNKSGNNNSANQPAANNVKAADKYKNPKVGTIVVTVQPGKTDIRTKEKYNLLNLYNVDVDSAKEIVARLNDTTKPRVTLKAFIDKAEPTHVCISVPQDKVDAWLDSGDLNAVQAVLIKSGKYDNNEVLQLEDKIAIGLEGQNTEKIKQAGNKAMENSLTMWQSYLSKINDPVQRKQIELYSRIFRDYKFVDENGVERNLGNVLSVRNAALIRQNFPDATFVLAPNLWRDLFKRGVRRNAKPIPYYVPNHTASANNQRLSDAQKANGWGDVKFSEIPIQARNKIRMDAEEKGDGYHFTYGYDVKDTYLLSGAKEDPWTTEIGLLNNLTGELNAKAKEKFKENQKQTIDGDDEMKARTEKACEWAEQALPQSGYSISSNYQDASNKLADYVYIYCRDNATRKARVLSDNNTRVYAENATSITLILTNLALDALGRFHSTYEYSKPEAKALMSVVWGIAKQLEENAVLTEGVFSWLKDKAAFVKRFLQAIRQIGCSIKPDAQSSMQTQSQPQQETVQQQVEDTKSIEDVRNNFNEVFNRINKNYFYDDTNRI